MSWPRSTRRCQPKWRPSPKGSLQSNVVAFERQPFIVAVSNGHVDFGYRGWYRKLVVDRISPDDVAWASNLLDQLSDRQWRDAFRAAGYETRVAGRFIRALQQRVDEGRSVTRRAAAN